MIVLAKRVARVGPGPGRGALPRGLRRRAAPRPVTSKSPPSSPPAATPTRAPSTTAGAHPFELENYFAVNRSPTAEELPAAATKARPRTSRTSASTCRPGWRSTPPAFPQCSQEAFNGGNCSAATQVGVANVGLADGQGDDARRRSSTWCRRRGCRRSSPTGSCSAPCGSTSTSAAAPTTASAPTSTASARPSAC